MDVYKELAAAIVERAVWDYKNALKQQDDSATHRLEGFFCSQWFEFLSDCDGKVVMEMVRRSAA